MSTMMPPNEPRSPSYARDQASIWKEIKALWQQTRGGQIKEVVSETLFSFAGKPTVVVQSPPYQPSSSANIYRVMVGLGTAGTTASTVKVYINGSEVSSTSIGIGEKQAFSLVDVDMNDGDVLTVAVSTLGTGALDFTVQVHWR